MFLAQYLIPCHKKTILERQLKQAFMKNPPQLFVSNADIVSIKHFPK